MPLYLLEPIRDRAPPFDEWDTTVGLVMRAKSEQHARDLAVAACERDRQSAAAWGDPALVRCEVIGSSGPAGVVMRSERFG